MVEFTLFLLIFLLVGILFFKNLDVFNSYEFFSKEDPKLFINPRYKNNNQLESLFLKEIKENNFWQICIPKIELTGNISEGTTEQVLDDYIGHFEESGTLFGTIGLAAHNRGYKNNYFSRLKELKKGDIIYYTYYGICKTFKVNELLIIENDNWIILSNEHNTNLTLITCMENQPSLRRCIKAIEM